MTWTPKAESTTWTWPPSRLRGRPRSATREAVEAMYPGDVLRIIHPDVSCHVASGDSSTGPTRTAAETSSQCGLSQILCRLRKEGWAVEMHHTQRYVAVVRRTA